ncbi:MAG: PKD domain-containing protein, partial [Sulfurimonadaceae bacterium]
AKPKPKLKHKPNASFSTRKKVYVSGESIDFIDLSTSEKSKVIDCKWDFGDGGNSKLCNPKYSYKKTGMYKIHLEITNSDGLKSDVVENVQIVHPAIFFGVDGRKFNRVVRKFGQPKQSIVKTGVLTQAHQYGSDWLLVKQNKVECRIKGSAFKTNLMGNPKNCHWYEKHAISAMYVLDQ